MKFSYNWLQTYFDAPLPSPEVLGERITAHSSEIEEIITLPHDTVIDVKVLPDKSAWLMSHRGLAKEISTMLGVPLKHDPFLTLPTLAPDEAVAISLTSPVCDFYGAAYLTGVTVGPSPVWLKERLEAIGQRSINNIVDATNYIMFELGQPLHAFDAGKLASATLGYHITVRQAKEGETIVTLTGETYTLTAADTIIVDGVSDTPIGIAGVKGGKVAAVDAGTKNIIIESAHFDRFAVRATSKRHKLQTDASKRYENGICPAVTPIALTAVTKLILEIAGGLQVAQNYAGESTVSREPVSVQISKANSVLGLSLTTADVTAIFDRFGFAYTADGDLVTVTPPFERDDLVIPEDLIEEIGRMHGLSNIASIAPEQRPVTEYNARQYYAQHIREILTLLGFSEVYTSSFRNQDIVALENALASDKGYLRSSLTKNLTEARTQNIPHRDLLGLKAVQLFEIGTVFAKDSEEFRVCLAVQSGTSYKAKIDDPLLVAAKAALETGLGVSIPVLYEAEGVCEFSLDALLPTLPPVTQYGPKADIPRVTYQAFSIYPAVSRDIAMWVPETETVAVIEDTLRAEAGPLCVRLTHLDTFTKEGRTSHAFRLVFQSPLKTLTDTEVQIHMDNLYKIVANKGWEAR